jgi:pilus biogenesis lipoprotein CpaD
MNRTSRAILVLMSPLLLAACDLRLNEYVEKAREHQYTELRKPVQVNMVKFTHDVTFDGGKSAPTAAEFGRFDAFAHSIKMGNGDEVVLRGGAPYRREAIATHIVHLGLPVTIRSEAGSNEEAASNTIKVTVNRYVVTPPACPDWSNFNGNDENNTPGSNYGCATDAGLSYMVANPRDLVQPQPMDPELSVPQLRTLGNYQQGKALKPVTSSTGGN